MELSHSRALIAIGELGSFSKAGDRLNLSPPAVFAQVQQLEEELGQKLYRRAGRGLVLTAAGRLLLGYCGRLTMLHDEAVESVRALDGVQRGSLSVGCGPHLSGAILPHLLRAFAERCPQVEVRLTTGGNAVLLDQLETGAADIIFADITVDERELIREPWWRYEMVFVVSPRDRLAERATAAADVLAERPFILFQRETREFRALAGFEPNLAMRNDQPDSIKELVKLGVGISLLPLWSVFEEARLGKLATVRLGETRVFGATGLLYRKSSRATPRLEAFREVARQWRDWLPAPPEMLGIEGAREFREAVGRPQVLEAGVAG